MIWFKFCRVVGFVVFDKYMKMLKMCYLIVFMSCLQICDQDNDGIMNDHEIYQFQASSFKV